ncbi:MAG: pyridoxal phosphate-dependent aminotransferase [Anaerolineales bacterium]|nr:pyridoxal phosphate-dependent aminotransferase [Anaerolineales bacterium]
MNLTFDQLSNRRNSDSEKWNYYDEDILPLWVADMDFLSPPEIKRALLERIEHGIFGYSKTQDASIEAVQNWLKQHHGWSVNPDEILLIPSVVQSFNLAAKAFTNPGDSVLLQTPAYHPFFDVSVNFKLDQIDNKLSQNKAGQYTIDREAFSAAVRPDTRIFLLCNPQNPTGRVFTREELLFMAQVCLENKIIICSDEIHSDLVYSDSTHIPIATLSEEIANYTVTMISATKTFNVAGLKSSAVIITNPHLRKLFLDHMRGLVGTVNILGEIALKAAYTHGSDWLTALLVYLEENRQVLFDFVQSELPGIRMALPESTYLGWLDCEEADLENPGEFFLSEARVALNPGNWFGEDYYHFVRINFGCPKETLLIGLDRMKKALATRKL